MIRLNLNSARSGVLFHFTHSMKTVEKIVENGLRTSSQVEDHTRKVANNKNLKSKLSRMYAEHPEMAFVSLARSPSVITRVAYDFDPEDPAWRYGVIFSADRLSDIAKIIPYQFHTSNREFDLTVYELEDDPGGLMYGTDSSPDRTVHSTGHEPDGEEPIAKFLDVFYQMEDDPNCPLETFERPGVYTIGGALTSDYSFKDLPKLIQQMLLSTGYESEDRLLFPGKPTKTIIPETKKAIIGIIVPDTTYWSAPVEDFRDAYPEYPIYAYRDPKSKPIPGTQPVPSEAYRLPTA